MSDFDVRVYFDGACPLCVRECQFLRRRDRRQRIQFVDIAEPGFDPQGIGVSWEQLMSRIHATLPDGTLIHGVEVFRHLYIAAGFRRLVALTRLPGVSQCLSLCYRVFARYRLRLTGRCTKAGCQSSRSEPVSL